jgi:hypothetical protein
MAPAFRRLETEWERMRMVVEERFGHWQAFVYNPSSCEVLYTGSRMTMAAAQIAAVDFAAVRAFGAHHDLKLEVIAAMLVWESK